jgi:anti-sigma B factor antagonist
MVQPVTPPRLSVSRSRRGETEILHIAGEIDMSSVDTLEQDLLEAVATTSPPAPIILECSGVTFLGSCGISLLLSVHRVALSQDTPIRIVAPQRAVRRPIHLIGYGGTLQLHTTIVDAVKRPAEARSGV